MNENISSQYFTLKEWINWYFSKNHLSCVNDPIQGFVKNEIATKLLQCYRQNFPSTGFQTLEETLLFICQHFQISDVDVNSIVDGDETGIRHFLWELVYRCLWREIFEKIPTHIKPPSPVEFSENWLREELLLPWCRQRIGNYRGIHLKDLCNSWRDGSALLAIIHSYRHDLFDYEDRLEKTIEQNVNLALHLAQEHFHIPRLLHSDMFISSRVASSPSCLSTQLGLDNHCIFVYLLQMYLDLNYCSLLQEKKHNVSTNSLSSSISSSHLLHSDEDFLHKSIASHPDVKEALDWLLNMEDRLKQLNESVTHFRSQFNLPTLSNSEEGSAFDATFLNDLKLSSSRLSNDVSAFLTYINSSSVDGNNSTKELFDNIKYRITAASDQFCMITRLDAQHEKIVSTLLQHQEEFGQTLALACRLESEEDDKDEDSDNEANGNPLKEGGPLSTYLAQRWDVLCEHNTVLSTRVQQYLDNSHGLLRNTLQTLTSILDQTSAIIGPELTDIKRQLSHHQRAQDVIELGNILFRDLTTFLKQLEETLSSSVESQPEEDADEVAEREERELLRNNISEILSTWQGRVDAAETRFQSLQDALLKWRQFCEDEQSLLELLQDPFSNTLSDEEWTQHMGNLWGQVNPLFVACGSNSATIKILHQRMDQLKALRIQASIDIAKVPIPTHSSYESLETRSKSGVNVTQPRENILQFESANMNESYQSYLSPPSPALSRGNENQSPYRAEFEQTLQDALAWLEAAEECLEQIPSDNDVKKTAATEVHSNQDFLAEVGTLQEEMPTWRSASLNRVHQLSAQYCQAMGDMSDSENEVEQLLEELNSQWERVESMFNARSSSFQNGWLSTSRFHVKLIDLRRYLSEQYQWTEDTVSPLLTHHEGLENESISVLEDVIKELKSNLATLVGKEQDLRHEFEKLHSKSSLEVEIKNELQNRYDVAFTEYCHCRDTMEERRCDLITILLKSLRLDPLAEILLSLKNVEELLKTEHKITSPDSYSDMLERVQEFVDNLKSQMNVITELEGNTDQDHDLIVDLLLSTKLQIKEFLDQLDIYYNHLKNNDNMLNALLLKLDQLDKWLHDMQDYLEGVDVASLNVVELVQSQLTETSGAMEDMLALAPVLSDVQTQIELLEPHFHDKYTQTLRQQLQQMCDSWRTVKSLIQSQSQQLIQKLTQWNIVSSNAALQMLINSIPSPDARLTTHSSLPLTNAQYSSYDSSTMKSFSHEDVEDVFEEAGTLMDMTHWIIEQENELQNIKSIDETTLENIISLRKNLREALEDKKAILSSRLNGTEEFARTQLRLQQLEVSLDKEEGHLKKIASWLKEFHDHLNEGTQWALNVLEAIEHVSSHSWFQLTSLEEDIQVMQTLASSYKKEMEKEEKLLKLHETLVQNKVNHSETEKQMNQLIQQSGESYQKLEQVIQRLQKRLKRLQMVEENMKDMSSWINITEPILRSRIAADIVGEDVPEELELLSKDISHYQDILTDLQKISSEATTYGSTKEELAACQERVELLQNSFQEIHRLFLRYSRPADFEPRLARVQGELDYVAEHICLLDIISLTSQDLQNSMEHATKFLNTLNEVDTELDFLLKTGRTLAAQGQVEFPERLINQLDAIEDKHITLMRQVTCGLDNLRKAGPLIDELENHTKTMRHLIHHSNLLQSCLHVTQSLDSQNIMLQKVLPSLREGNELCTLVRDMLHHLEPLLADSDLVRLAIDDVVALTDRVEDCHAELQNKSTALEMENRSHIQVLRQLNEEIALIDEKTTLLSEKGDSPSNVVESLTEIHRQLSHVKSTSLNLVTISNQQQERITNRLVEVNDKFIATISQYNLLPEQALIFTSSKSSSLNMGRRQTFPLQNSAEQATIDTGGDALRPLAEIKPNNGSSSILLNSLITEMNTHRDSILLFCFPLTHPVEEMLNKDDSRSRLKPSSRSQSVEDAEEFQEGDRIAGGSDDEESSMGEYARVISLEALKNQIKIFNQQRHYLETRIQELSSFPDIASSDEFQKIHVLWEKIQAELKDSASRIYNIRELIQEFEREKASLKKYMEEDRMQRVLDLLTRLQSLGFNLQQELTELDQMAKEDRETHIQSRLKETQWSALKLEEAIRSMTEEKLREAEDPTSSLNNTTTGPQEKKSSTAADRRSSYSPSVEKMAAERRFRERLRILCQHLNGVRRELDECYFHGTPSTSSDAAALLAKIKNVDNELKTCTDILLGLNYHIQTVNPLLLPEELFNMTTLLDVQKQRHLNYSRELLQNYGKWIIEAESLKAVPHKLEQMETELVDLERRVALINENSNQMIQTMDVDIKKEMEAMQEKIIGIEEYSQHVNSTSDGEIGVSELTTRVIHFQQRLDQISSSYQPHDPVEHENLEKIISSKDVIVSTSVNQPLMTIKIKETTNNDSSVNNVLSSSATTREEKCTTETQSESSQTIEEWIEYVENELNELFKWEESQDGFSSVNNLEKHLLLLRTKIDEVKNSHQDRYIDLKEYLQKSENVSKNTEIDVQRCQVEQDAWNSLLCRMDELDLQWSKTLQLWKVWEQDKHGLREWTEDTRNQWEQVNNKMSHQSNVELLKHNIRNSVQQCKQDPLSIYSRTHSNFRAFYKQYASLSSSLDTISNGSRTSAISRSGKQEHSSSKNKMFASIENEIRHIDDEWRSLENLIREDGEATNLRDDVFLEVEHSATKHSSTQPALVTTNDDRRWKGVKSSDVSGLLYQSSVNRFLEHWQQLFSWLELVQNFLSDNIVILTDKFEEESMMLRIKHYKEERRTKEALLERIALEAERIQAREDTPNAEVHNKVEEIQSVWEQVTKCLSERAVLLERMAQDSKEWDRLHTDLNKWLHKSELEWENFLAIKNGNNLSTSVKPTSYNESIRNLQTSIPEGQNKWETFCQQSEHLLAKHQNEDISKVKMIFDQMTLRWNIHVARVKEVVNGIPAGSLVSMKLDMSTPMGQDIAKIREQLLRLARHVELLETDLTLKGTNTEGKESLTKYWQELEDELQILCGEISEVSHKEEEQRIKSDEQSQQERHRRSSNFLSTISETETASLQWFQLKEQLQLLRAKLDQTPEDSQMFLNRLRKLNDLLSFHESEFRQMQNQPLGGDLNTLTVQYRSVQNLLLSINSHRGEVESVLEQGNAYQNQDTVVEVKGLESQQATDSGSESDGTGDHLNGVSTSNVGSMSNGNVSVSVVNNKEKRIKRRIRRQLHLLKRQWVELILKVKDSHDKLSTYLEHMKHLDTAMLETDSRLKFVEIQLTEWSMIHVNSIEMREAAYQQTENCLDSCHAIQGLLDNIDGQVNMLCSYHIVLSHHVSDRLADYKSRLAHVQLAIQERLTTLNNSLFTGSALQKPMNESEDLIQSSISIPIQQSPASVDTEDPFKFLQGSVSDNWQRCLHHSGNLVPFYKNLSTQEVQWDHPEFLEIMQSVQRINQFRFCAYRCGMKLRLLQKELSMDLINLSMLKAEFQRLQIHFPSSHEQNLNLIEIGHCLHNVYTRLRSGDNPYADDKSEANKINSNSSKGLSHSKNHQKIRNLQEAEKDRRESSIGCSAVLRASSRKGKKERSPTPEKNGHTTESSISRESDGKESLQLSQEQWMHRIANQLLQRRINVARCVDLIMNWLLNVFDTSRTGKIRVFSFKVALAIISGSSLDEKYRYLYGLICDTEGNATERRLTQLVQVSLLLPTQLGESAFFGGTNTEPSVRQCFEKSNGDVRPYIRLNHFLAWLQSEPQSMVWLPVLHRLVASESALHDVRCFGCDMQPIQGLRYRCLRCLKYNLCQHCFFTGKQTKSHKLTHPMQEYCSNITSGENLRDMSRIVRNRFKSGDQFRRTHTNNRMGFQPTITAAEASGTEGTNPSSPVHATQPVHPAIGIGSPPQLNPLTSQSNSLAVSPAHQFAQSPNNSVLTRSTLGVAGIQSTDASNRSPILNNIPLQQHQMTPVIVRHPPPMITNPPQVQMEDEHQRIAQMIQGLRRGSNPDLFAVSTSPMFSAQQATYALPVHYQRSTSPAVPTNYTEQYKTIQKLSSSNYPSQPQTDSTPATILHNGGDLGRMIHGLEMENRQLLAEYERLRAQNSASSRAMTPNRQLLQQSMISPSGRGGLPYPSQMYGYQSGGTGYMHPAGTMTLGRATSNSPAKRGYPLQTNALSSLYGPNFNVAGGVQSSGDPLALLQSSASRGGPQVGGRLMGSIATSHQSLLDARMQQLEEHNSHLESQLARLKHYILSSQGRGSHTNVNVNLNELLPSPMQLHSSAVNQSNISYSINQQPGVTNRQLIGGMGGIGGGSFSLQATPMHQIYQNSYNHPYSLNHSSITQTQLPHLARNSTGMLASASSDVELYTAQQYAQSRRNLGSGTSNRVGSSSGTAGLSKDAGIEGTLPRHSHGLLTSREQLYDYSTGGSRVYPPPTYPLLGSNQWTPQHQVQYSSSNMQQSWTATTPLMGRYSKAASEGGGSLGDQEFSMLVGGDAAGSSKYVNQQTISTGKNSGSIGNLFHMAGQVGRVMGQLVDVMADEFGSPKPQQRHPSASIHSSTGRGSIAQSINSNEGKLSLSEKPPVAPHSSTANSRHLS